MNLRTWGHVLSGQPMTCNAHFVVTPGIEDIQDLSEAYV